MGLRNDLTDLQMKTMSLLHRAVLRLSGGRMLRSIGSMPALELHTLGRSTGKRRTTMLTAPVHGDGRYVLVASKGGDDRNPQWYLNLVANPDVELTVDGTTLRMRARTATVAEEVGGDHLRRVDVVDLLVQRRVQRHGAEVVVQLVLAHAVHQVEVQDRHRHVGRGNPDGVAGELSGQLGQRLGDGLRRARLGEHHCLLYTS